MRLLDLPEITVKSVEISKSLINFSQNGMVSYYLNNTSTTGDAARLAVCLRNRESKITDDVLAGICGGINIDYRIATNTIIPKLESLNWLKIKRDGNKILNLEESLPPIDDILTGLGSLWKENNPTLVEQGTLFALSELSKRPYSKDAMESEIEIDQQDFDTMMDFGKQAHYFGEYTSLENNQQILWTPLYWSKNQEKVESFLSKQSESSLQDLLKLSQTIKKFQGMPVDSLGKINPNLLNGGIATGLLPAIEIRSKSGESYKYLYSTNPQFDSTKNSDIFEKARMIVSCIRHGQYHSAGTRIKFPSLILRALKNDNLGSHPYAKYQYAILALHNIVRFENLSGTPKVRWIDSPENNIAAETAKLLLEGHEVLDLTTEELETTKLLVQGLTSYSSEIRRKMATEKIVASREHEMIFDRIGGSKI